MARLARVLSWSLVLLSGCLPSPAFAQAPAPDTVRIGPTTAVIYIVDLKAPPEYARWYHQAERCISAIAPAGPWYAPHRTLRGRYAAVRWFRTNEPWRDGLHGGMSTLAAWQPGHRITISAPYLSDSAIVMHEAVHDILAWNGMSDENDPHPAAFFDGRCAKAAYP